MAIRHSLEIGDGNRTKTVALLSNFTANIYIYFFFFIRECVRPRRKSLCFIHVYLLSIASSFRRNSEFLVPRARLSRILRGSMADNERKFQAASCERLLESFFLSALIESIRNGSIFHLLLLPLPPPAALSAPVLPSAVPFGFLARFLRGSAVFAIILAECKENE